jgi:hypothetical protein
MNTLQALGICMSISLVTSAILFAAISQPLTAFIGSVCPGEESVGFWLRFTMVMLFLGPLFFTVSFGLPHGSALLSLDAGQIIQRAVTATLIGAFFAMIVTGIWISSMARRASPASQNNTNKATDI